MLLFLEKYYVLIVITLSPWSLDPAFLKSTLSKNLKGGTIAPSFLGGAIN